MALWLWRPSRFLEPDEEEWQSAVWSWFLRHLGDLADLRLTSLVTPTPDFFPTTRITGHARALHVFEHVRKHAGMADWQCQLVEQPRRPEARVAEVGALSFDRSAPLGTFGIEGNRVVISYDPAALDDTTALVATLSHELCHYLLATQAELPPGEEDTLELATDLATVYLGFGLFGANSAFSFRQYTDTFSQGWQSSRQGYLSERMWCYALAIFFLLREQDIGQAKPFLKPHLFSDLRRATAYLRRNPDRMPSLIPPAS